MEPEALAIETLTNAPPLNMDEVRVDPKWALRIPANLALRRQLLPYTVQHDHVLIACKDDSDSQGLQAVQRYMDLPVLPTKAEPESLERSIESIFLRTGLSGDSSQSPARVNLKSEAAAVSDPDGGEVVALGDEIFHAALIQNATDIHIEPGESEVRIRIRVDGSLEEYRRVPLAVHSALISRLKVLAGMDIAERRAPQDGRFSLRRPSNRAIDVRAATIPTKLGERMTLRLLAMNAHELTMEKLGMLPDDLGRFEKAIEQPYGLVCLTGPTGCGKSTTLYAAIRKLIHKRSINVVTVEDPVEYVIEGISQVEVDSADKVSFHKALRSLLRHDPDVIMIGEIRDRETAEIAVRAALTGHLVLTTLHTNSARDTISRLVDMGMEPFLLEAVSRLFVAQRLVRRLCRHCRVPTEMKAQQAKLLGTPAASGLKIFREGGCNYCAGTGFAGRTGLFEMVSFRPENTLTGPADMDSAKGLFAKIDDASNFLVDDALEKLRLGITSFEQVATVIALHR